MKTLKIVVLTIVLSLIFGAAGSFLFIEIDKRFFTDNSVENVPNITKVDYPTIESSNYEIVVEKSFDTIVEIRTTVVSTSIFGESEAQQAGSGVIITNDGYIVTNNHVIKGATEVKITTSMGEEYDGTIIGADERSDIAIVKINATDLKYAALADSDKLKLGQEVVAIGNPLGDGLSCCNGIISALARDIVVDNNPMTVIQTNAAVNAGNSGGGLFNMNGDLIGVVNAKSSASYFDETSVEGMGYAIPSNTVSKILDDLMKYGYVKQRATLGVSVNSYAYRYGDYIGLLVMTVQENSAADIAGIENGDLIIKIDEKNIESYADMAKILSKHEVDDSIEVVFVRDGKEKTVKVVLKEATKEE